MKPAKTKRTRRQKGPANGKVQVRANYPVKRAATISATQAARTFSELLNRVRYRGESFVIERGGEAICEMTPAKPPRVTGGDLLALLRSLPKPDPGFWDAVGEATHQEPVVPESPWER
jgi:antitoxin (DNA-binding transcriptional repressor) of toxin-antitoxin stability system